MTYRAHCGACAGPLILVHVSGSGIWRYRCQECGHETPPRTTPAELHALDMALMQGGDPTSLSTTF